MTKTSGKKFSLISTKLFDDGEYEKKTLNYNKDPIWLKGKTTNPGYFQNLWKIQLKC